MSKIRDLINNLRELTTSGAISESDVGSVVLAPSGDGSALTGVIKEEDVAAVVEALSIDADSVTEDSTHRFISDAERTSWNNKPEPEHTQLEASIIDLDKYSQSALDNGQLDIRYYTKSELNLGQLDNRYHTKDDVSTGQLDDRYYTEAEVDTITTEAAIIMAVALG